jgi:TonB family protein
MNQLLKKSLVVIFLMVIGMGCSSNQSISSRDKSDQDFYRLLLSQVGSNLPTHVIVYAKHIISDISFLFVAQDTAKPNLILFMIAAKDSLSLGHVTMIDSAGSRIEFMNANYSRFQSPILKQNIVGFAELTWDKYVELCKIDSIKIETGRGRIYLGKDIMNSLIFLRNYYVERNPIEPPSENPAEMEPSVLKRVEPIYPPSALQSSLEGDVSVKVWIDKDGAVRKAVIIKTSSPIFNEAASTAARNWSFIPAKILDKPVSFWITIPFHFRLHP